jgi:hypothetical protein
VTAGKVTQGSSPTDRQLDKDASHWGYLPFACYSCKRACVCSCCLFASLDQNYFKEKQHLFFNKAIINWMAPEHSWTLTEHRVDTALGSCGNGTQRAVEMVVHMSEFGPHVWDGSLDTSLERPGKENDMLSMPVRCPQAVFAVSESPSLL